MKNVLHVSIIIIIQTQPTQNSMQLINVIYVIQDIIYHMMIKIEQNVHHAELKIVYGAMGILLMLHVINVKIIYWHMVINVL